MKIDLHNHTTVSSSCSILDPAELIHKAREAGLDGIAVTEHNTMTGGWHAAELGKQLGFPVFAGQEVTTRQGDVLCFGIYQEGLAHIDIRDLIALAQAAGAVLIPAHPYRINAMALGDRVFEYPGAFTALEGLNGNCDAVETRKALDAAERLHLPVIGGSDAHSTGMVGRYYTEFEGAISSQEDLLEALRQGRFRACHNPAFRPHHN